MHCSVRCPYRLCLVIDGFCLVIDRKNSIEKVTQSVTVACLVQARLLLEHGGQRRRAPRALHHRAGAAAAGGAVGVIRGRLWRLRLLRRRRAAVKCGRVIAPGVAAQVEIESKV